MATPITGKTALIIAGNQGLVAAISVLLAKSGANIVIIYHSDASAADKLVKTIRNKHAFAIKGDPGILSTLSAWPLRWRRVTEIDILVPWAGVLLLTDLEYTTEQDLDSLMQLKFNGPKSLP